MSPEHHQALNKLPVELKGAITLAATTKRIAVHHLVDSLLGRKVFATYPGDSLAEARQMVPPDALAEIVAQLAPVWPLPPAPTWIVMVAGGQADVTTVEALMKKHFDATELPVRVALRPGRAWVIARVVGDSTTARDIDPADVPEFVREVVAVTTFPKPIPEPYEITDAHAGDPMMVAHAIAGATKDDVIHDLWSRLQAATATPPAPAAESPKA